MSELKQAIERLAAKHHAERCPIDLGAIAEDERATPATRSHRDPNTRRRRTLVAIAVAASLALWFWSPAEQAPTPASGPAERKGAVAASPKPKVTPVKPFGAFARLRRVAAAEAATGPKRTPRLSGPVRTGPLTLRSRRWASGPLALATPRPNATAPTAAAPTTKARRAAGERFPRPVSIRSMSNAFSVKS